MNGKLLVNKDFLAGLVFLIIGVLAVVFARGYPMGTLARMGPGYFPIALGVILVLFGAYLIYRGIHLSARIKGEWGWRALGLISLSIMVFGLSMEKIGLVPALFVLFFIAALAGREFRVKEVLLLGAVMSAFAAGVFVYGFKLPYPLFGTHLSAVW